MINLEILFFFSITFSGSHEVVISIPLAKNVFHCENSTNVCIIERNDVIKGLFKSKLIPGG